MRYLYASYFVFTLFSQGYSHSDGPLQDTASSTAMSPSFRITNQRDNCSPSLSQSSRRAASVALTGVQFGICFYLVREIWKAFADLFNEFEQGNSMLSMIDDNDLPCTSEEVVDTLIDSLCNKFTGNTTDMKSFTEINQKNSKVSKHASFLSDLAFRLHESGMVLSSDDQQKGKSVRQVLKSLTRVEVRLLANALLSPSSILDDKREAGMQKDSLNVVKAWAQVGGLEDVKEGMLDLVFPLMEHLEGHTDPNYYGGLLKNPPGVLLYGPPGCGKTVSFDVDSIHELLLPIVSLLTPCQMLVRALAMTANARFLCVSPSTLLRKYVGETNINVKALFSLARKISPCIIFIDEVEGLFRERRTSGDEEHEVNRELKTEFMQLWDGIHKANEGVIIVGATNRPFDVDSALLRRMPRSFYVGLPDDKARQSIIKGILQNVPTSPHFSIDQVVTALSGYSPSDMKEVMRTAALFPLREARSQLFKSDKSSPYKLPKLRALETSDVLQACMKISPTQLSPEYASSLRSFTSNANRIGQSDPFQRNEDFFISNSVEDEEECVDSDLYDSSMNESYDDDSSF